VELCLASAGAWWAAFTVFPVRRLPARPAGERIDDGATLRNLRRYPLTLLFLAAFLCYNDGIQTVVSQASLFGSEELGMGRTALIGAVLLVQVVAIGGALLLGRLAARFGAKRTVLGSLVAWVAILALGYVMPAHQVAWFFTLAALIGLVLGGSQALSRSPFSHLVPPGREAEYFSAYEMGDRGMSWPGPLLFGVTYQLTGSHRDAIVSLVAFFVAGSVLLARVPVGRAIRDAGNPVPDRI
jgi:UMF1 family MFS transporter